MKKLVASVCLLGSNMVVAADYQTFASLSYVNSDGSGYDGFVLDATHYFAPQTTGGVMDEFGFLDTDSKIYGQLNNLGPDELVSLGGEYFVNQNFFINGAYARYGDSNAHSLGLGYLLNDNLKLNLFRQDSDDADATYQVSASYNHALSGYDYVGVTISSDTDFDGQEIAARYFTALTDQQFLAIDASVQHTDYDDIFSAEATYYFNPAMSVGVGVSDSEWLAKAKIFVDSNTALFASYADGPQVFTVGVTGQY